MKKLLSLLTLLVLTLTASATAYHNTLYVQENGEVVSKAENAEITVVEKTDGKFDVTLPAFSNADTAFESFTFEATGADGKLTATNVVVPGAYSGFLDATVSMDGTIKDGKLTATFDVDYDGICTLKLGYGVSFFTPVTTPYIDWANVKQGDAEPVNFENAKVDWTEYEKGVYSVTFKNLTINGAEIGDFEIKDITADENGALTTSAFNGTWTRVVEGNAVGAAVDDIVVISDFQGSLANDKLVVKYTMDLEGTTGNVAVVFGEKYVAPILPVIYKNDLIVVRGDASKCYENAEVSVLDKGEGKYEVILPEFSDMDTPESDVIKQITFEANGEEVDGNLHLTAKSEWGNTTGDGVWGDETFNVNMDATVADGKLAGTFTVKHPEYTSFDFTLYYGVPATLVYKNTLYVQENGEVVSKAENAEITVVEKTDGKFDVTLPAFSNADTAFESFTFEATGADGKLTATNVVVPGAYSGFLDATVSMDGTIKDGKLTATFDVDYDGICTLKLGYGVSFFTPVTTPYIDWANVKQGDAEPVNFENAKVDWTEYEKGVYSVTFKNLTINGAEIGDFEIKDITADENGALTTSAFNGTWTRVVEGNAVGAAVDDIVVISDFQGSLANDKLVVKYTMDLEGTTGNVAVVFGEKYVAPILPVIYKNDLIVVRGDASKCYENAEVSVLDKGEGKYEVILPEFSDMDTPESDVIKQITFEANGEEVDGNLHLTAKSEWGNTTGDGVWGDETFNVSMDATVADGKLSGTFTVKHPEYTSFDFTLYYGVPVSSVVGVNAETANGKTEIFTLDGVKLNSLKKGLNIVRTTDGKVKKVMVK